MNSEINIILLQKDDIVLAAELGRLFNEVFETTPRAPVTAPHLSGLLGQSNFIAYAAIHHDEVVGGLTAYVLPMLHSGRSEILIYDIAIDAKYQRKGIGKKLISTLNEFALQNGIPEIFVDASESDNHALEFYRSAGAKGEKTVQFTFFQNITKQKEK